MREAHAALREATRDAHERVDAAFARFDLADRADYAAFLIAHARVVLPLEAWLDAHAPAVIDDWPERRRGALLEDDLSALGAPSAPSTAPIAPAMNADPASVAGALYVIEGSRLGGRMLAPMVGAGLPRAYLDAPAVRGAWSKLLGKLDELLYEPRDRSIGVASATRIFDRFEQAARG